MHISPTEVCKVNFLSVLGNFHAVGKPSDEIDFIKNFQIQPQIQILWSKIDILDYRGIIIFWFIILLYHINIYRLIGSKQWIWIIFQRQNGVNEICKCNHPYIYDGIHCIEKVLW